jgi:hypothetical protein
VLSAGCGGVWYGRYGRYGRYGGSGSNAARYYGAVALTLVNDTGVPVCQVRMGPSYDPYWGDNWLTPGEVIPQGAQRTFPVAGGAWDVQVSGCDGAQISQQLHVPMFASGALSVRTLQPVALPVAVPAFAPATATAAPGVPVLSSTPAATPSLAPPNGY